MVVAGVGGGWGGVGVCRERVGVKGVDGWRSMPVYCLYLSVVSYDTF